MKTIGLIVKTQPKKDDKKVVKTQPKKDDENDKVQE